MSAFDLSQDAKGVITLFAGFCDVSLHNLDNLLKRFFYSAKKTNTKTEMYSLMHNNAAGSQNWTNLYWAWRGSVQGSVSSILPSSIYIYK